LRRIALLWAQILIRDYFVRKRVCIVFRHQTIIGSRTCL
jgi:hypothetical protein